MVIDDQLSPRRHLAKALTDSGLAVGERNTWSERTPGVVVAAEVVNLGRELL